MEHHGVARLGYRNGGYRKQFIQRHHPVAGDHHKSLRGSRDNEEDEETVSNIFLGLKELLAFIVVTKYLHLFFTALYYYSPTTRTVQY